MSTRPLDQILSPPDAQDAFSLELVASDDYGFVGAKRLPDGTYVGIIRLFTTVAICIGITEFSAYRNRYCFDDLQQCLIEYEKLESGDSVPEGWVATRP